MTAVLFPAATAARATTPKACDCPFCINGTSCYPDPDTDEPVATEPCSCRSMQVSWLILPAGVVVQPGDRITITAQCETCSHRAEWCGYGEGLPDDNPRCSAGVVTYGEATVAEVVPAANDIDDYPDLIAAVEVEVWSAGVLYWGEGTSEPGEEVDISDQFPDGPPQPGDTCIRITDVKAAR